MMNIKAGVFAGALVLALVGCSEGDDRDNTPATDTQAALDSTSDTWNHWVCEGETIVDWREVEGQDAIDLRLGGDDIVRRLEQAVSGSGVRYTDGQLTFHTKADEGVLYWNENEENIDVNCRPE